MRNGEIYVNSAVGKGSVFKITLRDVDVSTTEFRLSSRNRVSWEVMRNPISLEGMRNPKFSPQPIPEGAFLTDRW
jgi:hypothetical protein